MLPSLSSHLMFGGDAPFSILFFSLGIWWTEHIREFGGPGSPSEPGSIVPGHHANAYMGGARTIMGLVPRRGRPVEEDVDPPDGGFRGARCPAAARMPRKSSRTQRADCPAAPKCAIVISGASVVEPVSSAVVRVPTCRVRCRVDALPTVVVARPAARGRADWRRARGSRRRGGRPGGRGRGRRRRGRLRRGRRWDLRWARRRAWRQRGQRRLRRRRAADGDAASCPPAAGPSRRRVILPPRMGASASSRFFGALRVQTARAFACSPLDGGVVGPHVPVAGGRPEVQVLGAVFVQVDMAPGRHDAIHQVVRPRAGSNSIQTSSEGGTAEYQR